MKRDSKKVNLNTLDFDLPNLGIVDVSGRLRLAADRISQAQCVKCKGLLSFDSSWSSHRRRPICWPKGVRRRFNLKSVYELR